MAVSGHLCCDTSRHTGSDEGRWGPMGHCVTGTPWRGCEEWLPDKLSPERELSDRSAPSSCDSVDISWDNVDTSWAVEFRSPAVDSPSVVVVGTAAEGWYWAALLQSLVQPLAAACRPSFDDLAAAELLPSSMGLSRYISSVPSVPPFDVLVTMLEVRAVMDDVRDDKESVSAELLWPDLMVHEELEPVAVAPTNILPSLAAVCSSCLETVGARDATEWMGDADWLSSSAWDPGNWQNAFITWLAIDSESCSDSTCNNRHVQTWQAVSHVGINAINHNKLSDFLMLYNAVNISYGRWVNNNYYYYNNNMSNFFPPWRRSNVKSDPLTYHSLLSQLPMYLRLCTAIRPIKQFTHQNEITPTDAHRVMRHSSQARKDGPKQSMNQKSWPHQN